ncbi:putative Myb/SANT-like domain-containing protein [Dioscorea sansibarensis]
MPLTEKEGSTFKREAWQDMLVRFNEKTDMNIDADQLKNRLRFYRHEYRTVMTLRSLPEFGWDEKKQLVVADEACWSKSITKNKAARFYKQKPVTCFRELEIIFGSSKDNGNRSCSGQDTDAPEEDTIEGMDGFEATEVSNLNVVSKDENNDPSDPSTTPNTTNLLTAQTPQQSKIINHRKRHRSYSGVTLTSNRHEDISDMKVESVPASLGADPFKCLDKCISELNTMEGLDDDLYVKTLIILRDEYNRYVFLRTNGHRRLAWLRVATRDADV